jgi:flagellar biosynthesis anti-sigma factor FlgM
MKINNTPNPEALKAYTSNSVGNAQPYRDTAAVKPASPSVSVDKVNISSTVKLFQDIQKTVLNAPDIRTDKVKAVETKIAEGTYEPDYNAVADKLLSPDISSRI